MTDRRTILRGITWNHTRGYLPVVAASQRFSELYPDIEVEWEKRSLKAFEEYPVERLASDFDLIVLDHPFVGYAAEHGPLIPLDEHLPEAFLADQAAQSVGASHASYHFAGHQWALAIDAAGPVAFWRPDLAEKLGVDIPRTWDELLELARSGRVEIPAAPINCLMNFYMLCVALDEVPFQEEDCVVSGETALEALGVLRELLEASAPGSWFRNPIGSHDLVSSAKNDRIVYCPFAYGYSNYARAGYADHRLTFGEPVSFRGKPLQPTLGGTGLAVSALRSHREEALRFAEYAASGPVQRTLGAFAGGQPGHRTAWHDPDINRISGDYFSRTLPALDRAYVRPRYCGYMEFQEQAGPVLQAALRRETRETDAISRMNELYRASLRHASSLS